MKDYRIGSELDWLKHANEELTQELKKRERQVNRWRSLSFLLVVLLAYVVYQFSQHQPLRQLF